MILFHPYPSQTPLFRLLNRVSKAFAYKNNGQGCSGVMLCCTYSPSHGENICTSRSKHRRAACKAEVLRSLQPLLRASWPLPISSLGCGAGYGPDDAVLTNLEIRVMGCKDSRVAPRETLEGVVSVPVEGGSAFEHRHWVESGLGLADSGIRSRL